MCDNVRAEIRELEEKLSYLISPHMTAAEKQKALEASFWRSHNAGFCDYMAGQYMAGIDNGQTRLHDLDCKYKWEVSRLLKLLRECADTYCLVARWDYTYDKEGTWFDKDSGENRYELKEGASYPLPCISKKCLEIQSVTVENGIVSAVLHIDHQTVTVCSDKEPLVAHASNSYSVCGDCVDESLCLKLSLEKQ